MRILTLAILTIAAISATPSARAQTYNPRYPICAKFIQNFGGERIECGYDSMEQCQERVAGLGGTCIVNPYYGRGRR
jgi:hypothetical protein